MTTPAYTFTKPPSALRFMLQALRQSPGWHRHRAFPDLCLSWRGFQIDAHALRTLQRIAPKGSEPSMETLGVLAPQVSGFRLLTRMLSHRRWPLPVWGALQVRNRLVLHQPIRADDSFDLTTRMAAWRVLEKGLEVDLHTRLCRGAECSWESVVTFYYRGRFGEPAAWGTTLGAPAAAPTIDVSAEIASRWRIEGNLRWQFAALTGDYNGIHQWDAYARRFGFPAAFAHPQRIIAQCLGQVQALHGAPQQLDLWIKGPVFYRREVLMHRQGCSGAVGHEFSVDLCDDARPALIGCWRGTPAG